MEFILDTTKTAHQNALAYFEKAKKSKKRLTGAQTQLALAQKELEQLTKHYQKKQELEQKRTQEWFEKFRFSFTPNGLLCVGGRDATTNEQLIKKYLKPNDVIFHTELAGSPFVLLVDGKEKATQADKEYCAQFTACMSKAWTAGFSSCLVFSVDSTQISKNPNSGEYVSKGAFIIRGKKEQYHPILELGIYVEPSSRIIVGPYQAVKTRAKTLKLTPGTQKASDCAKHIQKTLQISQGQLDEIIRAIPSGSSKVHKLV
jgi:predicted ribosome quality control (RQC) complex YloA/Tae2 family protein